MKEAVGGRLRGVDVKAIVGPREVLLAPKIGRISVYAMNKVVISTLVWLKDQD